MYNKEKIESILRSTYDPFYLEVIDDSSKHRIKLKNTHFRVIIVSNFFLNISRVERHKAIYKLLNVKDFIYSISFSIFSEKEWECANILPAPKCKKI